MRRHPAALAFLSSLLFASCVDSPLTPRTGAATPTAVQTRSAPLDGAKYPDVVEAIPSHLQVQNDHQREWLRFSTTHMNIGEGNLQIRGGNVAPCVIDDGSGNMITTDCTNATQEILDAAGKVVYTQPAGQAFFHPEHNHWHQSGVAAFRIMKGDPLTGTQIASGVKITFCFVDVKTFSVTGSLKKSYPRTYFECNGDLQGLAAHWADEYHQSTPLQELEVTGVPEGDYYLTHEADPDQHWVESPSGGESNNFTWVKFHLARKGANPSITVLSHSPCVIEAQCGFGGNP